MMRDRTARSKRRKYQAMPSVTVMSVKTGIESIVKTVTGFDIVTHIQDERFGDRYHAACTRKASLSESTGLVSTHRADVILMPLLDCQTWHVIKNSIRSAQEETNGKGRKGFNRSLRPESEMT